MMLHYMWLFAPGVVIFVIGMIYISSVPIIGREYTNWDSGKHCIGLFHVLFMTFLCMLPIFRWIFIPFSLLMFSRSRQ